MVAFVADSRNRNPRFEPRCCQSFLSAGLWQDHVIPISSQCYSTQVRSVISCIRKGINEIIRVPRIARLAIRGSIDRTQLLLPRKVTGTSNKVTCLFISHDSKEQKISYPLKSTYFNTTSSKNCGWIIGNTVKSSPF